MPLTKEGARQLIRLQEQDKVLDSLQGDIDKIPVAIAEIRGRIDGRKSRLAEAKGKWTALQLKKKDKEAEVAAKEAGVKKHGGELNLVKTNEAFKALQSEIEKGKLEIGELETDILTLMEAIDQAAKDEKGVAAEIAGEDSKDQAEIKAFEQDKAGLEAKRAGEVEKRAGLVGGIAEDVIKHYDYLRKRKPGGIALSPVNKNMCGVCRITLPPQTIVDTMKGLTLVTCEACQRILYMPEGAAKTPAAATPPA